MNNESLMHRIDWWNIFFVTLFATEMIIIYRVMIATGTVPYSISLADAALLALATFRLTRLVAYDVIAGWVRDLFANGKERTFMGTVKVLINCPWCIGLWFALLVSALYFIYPVLWFVFFILALGGVATLVQLLANAIGWNAEYKKRMTQGLSQVKDGGRGTCG